MTAEHIAVAILIVAPIVGFFLTRWLLPAVDSQPADAAALEIEETETMGKF